MLTSSFPRFEGDSAGIFIYHLSWWLAKKGIKIEVISPHDHGCKYSESHGNIGINRFPYFYPLKYQRLCYGAGILKNVKRSILATIQIPSFIIAEILYSLWIIKKMKVDVIHAHWSLPQGLIGVFFKVILRVPCVATIHGSDIYGLRSTLLKVLNSKIIKHSDACTVNSGATARIARGVSRREDIEIVPMGVDPDFFKRVYNVDALRKKYKIDGKVILFVGRLIDGKGIDYLIKAIPKVLERYPETKIVLVGSGPQKDYLVNLSKDLGLENKVVFIDKVPQEELSEFYSLASLFVLPSIVNDKGETEGLGVVLLEAMACGVPVIGSNVGGIPDIIKDGETGLLSMQKDPYDLSEKIIRLLTDEKLKKKVIENGLKLVKERFSWEVIADKFIKIYKDVIKRDKHQVTF